MDCRGAAGGGGAIPYQPLNKALLTYSGLIYSCVMLGVLFLRVPLLLVGFKGTQTANPCPF